MNLPTTQIQRSGLTFTDKVVVITGGAKGIGSGCARVFTDAGAKVVIGEIDDEAAQAISNELSQAGPGTCAWFHCDVTKPDQLRSLIDHAIGQHGQLNCLINNAGGGHWPRRIDDVSLNFLKQVINLNFVSQFVACQHALPHLRKSKGSIVNMGSITSQLGQEGTTSYCASKGAVASFTKSLAIEEAASGVRVNAVLPGNILSDGRMKVSAEKGPELDKWIDMNQHFGRSGTCEEVGQVCLFLASEAASFITGTEVQVTAGVELGFGVKFPTKFI